MADPAPTYNINDGVHCADFIGRDQHITYGFSAADVEQLIKKVLEFMRAGAVFLPAPGQLDTYQIEHNGRKLIFHPGAAIQLAGQRSERAYLLSLTIEQEYQRWATRFVPLAGKMDKRQVIEGLPIAYTELIIPTGEVDEPSQITQRLLTNIAEAMQSYGAFVILGDPGAGKTTTLQKIAFDAARALLEGDQGRVPLFLRLSQQGEHDPYTFLQTEWERRIAIPFSEALVAGHILILADGINEIPRQNRNERLNAWMVFEQQYRGANQLIFTGRKEDYDNQLNLPRVLVEPLDDERIILFLRCHNAEGLAELLFGDSRLGEMARNPLNLFVLTIVYLQGGKDLHMLANRGRLIQSFALSLLKHEQLWHPDALSIDAKVEIFACLAYDMQQQGVGTTFELDAARQSIPKRLTISGEDVPVDTVAFLRFGRGASILDPATIPDVRFHHHLLQEYFAARELLRRFKAGDDLSMLWKAPRLAAEIPEINLGDWNPLPDPPSTGWEMTTILACGLAHDPACLIEAVRPHNPILAARCLDEAGIDFPPLNRSLDEMDGLKERVRADLYTDFNNFQVHLRARIQTGLMLGRIGDPRFGTEIINGVQVILPRMTKIPAGEFILGSDSENPIAHDDEYTTERKIYLPTYTIAIYPTTNAEFQCFINSGGYKEDQWWDPQGVKWKRGEIAITNSAAIRSWLGFIKYLQELTPGQLSLQRHWNPMQTQYWDSILKLSDVEIQNYAKDIFDRPFECPAFWKDREFNNLSKPIVGVNWYEADAYCRWLSASTNRHFHLPTEMEWEKAARGIDGKEYPWGDKFDPVSCNTLEGRVMSTTPVGLYLQGKSPFGLYDVSGNVWEWTSSFYLPYPGGNSNTFKETEATFHVLRGGGWNSSGIYARSGFREDASSDIFDLTIGFRVACDE